MITPARIALALLALPLAGCGQKGPLYLPDSTQGEVITRPTQTPAGTESPNSPATPGSPQQSTSPAPEVTAPDATDPDKDKKKDGATPPK